VPPTPLEGCDSNVEPLGGAEERVRAPRQVIASTLAANPDLLARVTVTMLTAAAQGDTKAAAWVLRAFPEGFGRVGEVDSEVEEDEVFTKEQRALLRAALDAHGTEEEARTEG
jgi:hypothetical protein